jgi:two-component system, NarL family, nitrate/nitrite response regulator NarL
MQSDAKFSNRPQTLGVLVADGAALTRQLITFALQRERSLEVVDVGDASVVDVAKRLRPDVIILSGEMDGEPGGGFETLKLLREAIPESRVVMLLDEENRQLVVNSMRLGARGVFCRCHPLKMLARCIHRVHEGQFWVSSCQMEFLLDALSNAPVASVVDSRGTELLSPREQQVVRWMADGLSNREIAGEMRLSENTVKNYVYRIFNKLGVSNRVEVAMYAANQRPLHGNGHAAAPQPSLLDSRAAMDY